MHALVLPVSSLKGLGKTKGDAADAGAASTIIAAKCAGATAWHGAAGERQAVVVVIALCSPSPSAGAVA